MNRLLRPLPLALTLAMIGGCASLPSDRGYSGVTTQLQRTQGDAHWPEGDPAPTVPAPQARPDSADAAVRLAFAHSPRLHALYAEIGLARADLEEARRLANPELGWERERGGGVLTLSHTLTLGLTDALLQPARRRMGDTALAEAEARVAAEWQALAHDVAQQWVRTVGAFQVAQMRGLVAEAAQASADLTQRYVEAGNLSARRLAQEQVAAAQATLDADAALDAARDEQAALSRLVGVPLSLPSPGSPTLPLPAALPSAVDGEALWQQALRERLDLEAARRAVALRQQQATHARRFAWLGEGELELGRDREGDEHIQRRGVSLALPLFHQGQAERERAAAELRHAQAELAQHTLDVRVDVNASLRRLRAAQARVKLYRERLLPASEAAVARLQEEVNFMLKDVFELLEAKQEQYDAYQGYLETVRDAWLAQGDLQAALGGRLPWPSESDGEVQAPVLRAPAADPHAHHRMPASQAPATSPKELHE